MDSRASWRSHNRLSEISNLRGNILQLVCQPTLLEATDLLYMETITGRVGY